MSSIGSTLFILSLAVLLAPPAHTQSFEALKQVLDRSDPDHQVPNAAKHLAEAGCRSNNAVLALVSGNEKEFLQDVKEAGSAYAMAATYLNGFSRTEFAKRTIHPALMSTALDEEFGSSNTISEMARRIAALTQRSAQIAEKIAAGKATRADFCLLMKQSRSITLDFTIFLDAIASPPNG